MEMTWRKECLPDIGHRKRETRVRKNDSAIALQERGKQPTRGKKAKITIFSMHTKQFRQALTENCIAKLYHATAQNFKGCKIQLREGKHDYTLNGTNDRSFAVAR